jgi:hypothetical protein
MPYRHRVVVVLIVGVAAIVISGVVLGWGVPWLVALFLIGLATSIGMSPRWGRHGAP